MGHGLTMTPLSAWQSSLDEVPDDLRKAKRSAPVGMSMEDAYASAAVALDASTADRRALEWAATSQIEMDLAADLKDLSLSGFDEDEAFSGRDVLFPNGYSRMGWPKVSISGPDSRSSRLPLRSRGVHSNVRVNDRGGPHDCDSASWCAEVGLG